MKKWHRIGAGLVVFASLVPSGWGQAPVTSPAAAAAPAAAPAAAAQGQTLWGMLGLSKENLAGCKEKFCKSQMGTMFNNMMAPARMYSGGLLPNCCPGLPTPDELKDQGAVGAAAAIKKKEAEAKARREAIKYLATVNCYYYPEAKAALIGALLNDPNECVRFEAAAGLGSGCCCDKDTIAALATCISGDIVGDLKSDFKPEISDRVKEAAEQSLQRCLGCYSEVKPVTKGPETGGPKPPEPGGTNPPETGKPNGNDANSPKPNGEKTSALIHADIKLAAFYANVEKKSQAEVINWARQVLAEKQKNPPVSHEMPTGSHSLFEIVKNASLNPQVDSGMIAEESPRSPGKLLHSAIENIKPREPEPPTDLMSILMGRRQSRPTENPEPTKLVPQLRPIEGDSKRAREDRLSPIKKEPAIQETKTISATGGYHTIGSMSQQSVSAVVSNSPSRPAPSGYNWVESKGVTTTGMVTASPSRDKNQIGVRGLMIILRDADDSMQRKWAAEKLGSVSWQAEDNEVVAILVKAARLDSAPAVRIECIHTLAAKNIKTVPVVNAICQLKADADPRVQHEADNALVRLGVTKPTSPHQTLSPAINYLPGRSN